jgi:hypothetical protein
MADCDHVFSFFDGLEDGGYTGLDRSLKVKASSWHNFVDCITKSLALDSLLTIVRLVYIPTRASPPESNAIPPGLNRAAIDPGITVGGFHIEAGAGGDHRVKGCGQRNYKRSLMQRFQCCGP